MIKYSEYAKLSTQKKTTNKRENIVGITVLVKNKNYLIQLSRRR